MARFDLTDAEWTMIELVLPTDTRGVEHADDRRLLNGIFYRLRTGAARADIPARCDPHTTCGNRFRRWRKAGVREAIEAVCARLLYLPPYGPDFNPTEQVFAKAKALLLTAVAQTAHDLTRAIHDAFAAFRPDECRSYLTTAGYDAFDPT